MSYMGKSLPRIGHNEIYSPCSIKLLSYRMWRRWWCWRVKARISKGFGDLSRKCRCVLGSCVMKYVSGYRGGVREIERG